MGNSFFVMKNFFLCLISAWCLTAAADSYNLEKMNQFLDSLNGMATYDPQGMEPSRYVESEPLSPVAHEIFESIQRVVFGSARPIGLQSCLGCQARACFGGAKVLVDPDFVNLILTPSLYSNTEGTLTYILAHEVSHFVHELSTRTSGDGMSINQLPSTLQMIDPQEVTDQAFLPIAKAHAEIDVYALLILKRLGITDQKGGLEFLETNSHRYNRLDFIDKAERINAIRSVSSRIWNGD